MLTLQKLLLATALLILPLSNTVLGAPVITVWYGDTQSFGNVGEPQEWCNILGHVSAAGGLSSFSYTLNPDAGGSPVSLSVGPDNRRLENTGDFNIDLAVADLLNGSNTVEITAIDNASNTTTETVTINYTGGNVWPTNYSVDWSTLGGITAVNDVAHVVDGKFALLGGGIRTTEPGYDRLIALGDVTWDNYEVLVPITIHDMPSGAGVGVLLRWTGHTTMPVSCTQPQCGYEPLGNIAWYRPNRLEFFEGGQNVSRTLSLEQLYWFRVAVETVSSGSTNYRMRVWQQGDTEPDTWDLQWTEGIGDLPAGSLLLISHLADATFGDVAITPVPLTISDVNVQLGNNYTEATITWTTNQPTTSRVDYGTTASYGSSEEDLTLKTDHALTLTGLTSNSAYHFQLSGTDASSQPVMTTDDVFRTDDPGIRSDDFCDANLDPMWTFENPLSDAGYDLTRTALDDRWVEISVPAGTEHQVFTTLTAPQLLQSNLNSTADFEVEVKFESPVVTPQYQEQGIIVRQSATRYLRFEFFSSNSSGGSTQIYAQSYDGGSALPFYINTSIGAAGLSPLYMRVKREGNQWTQRYSTDGSSWTTAVSFTNDLAPTEIGPYAGNAIGASSPAHTAKIDYFMNLAEPILPADEDDCPAAPVIDGIADQNLPEGGSQSLTITATDLDGPDTDIRFTSPNLPSFATLTDNLDGTATLDLNPTTGDAGTYSPTIVATDQMGGGLSDNTSFDINVATAPSNLASDYFCSSTLNTSIWTFVDPLGGASHGLPQATQLEITVPAGQAHELWEDGIEAPHVWQAANNVDFIVEAKFTSPVNSPQFQEQGILIKQDDDNFLRFEFYSSSSNTMALTAVISPGTNGLSGSITSNGPIASLGTKPLFMRVSRSGDNWVQSYSFDGTAWANGETFTHALNVSAVGLYAGNAGTVPEHTAKIDYFTLRTQAELGTPVADPCATALPVELIAFTARAERETVLLTWTTASEKDNDYFAVEHSTDGRRFRTIGIVAGARTTEVNTSYRFVHEDPASGDNYYRLRQVDLDGKTSYSWIEAARFDSNAALSVYPNPATSIVNIHTSDALLNKHLKIFNTFGGLHYSGVIQRDLLRLDVASWPPGVYHIQIEGHRSAGAYRFVVQ